MPLVQLAKRLVPKPIKRALKRAPALANTFDLLLAGRRRDIPVYTAVDTLLSAAEREELYRLAQHVRNGDDIVEIGVYAGGSAYFLAKGLEATESRASCVHGVDPFLSAPDRQRQESDGSPDSYRKKPGLSEVRSNLTKLGIDGRVILHEGFSEDIARDWRERVGMLWIDGNHTQAYADFRAWRPWVADGGIVAFHDSRYPENGFEPVTRDVERILREEWSSDLRFVDSITSFRLYRY